MHNQDASLCAKCEASKGGFNLGMNNATCAFPDGSTEYTPCSTEEQISPNKACFSATGLCMLLILLLYVKKRCSPDKQEIEPSRQDIKADIQALQRHHRSLGPKRYTNTDLKKITSSVKDKLGEGGFGSVYKGQLQNGKLVAVKIQHKDKVNLDEFMNEVAGIGNPNHVNIVKLLGFCYEGHRRAHVYELMANGSLKKFLHKGDNHHSLGWEILFKIAIGVARGLEYLHRGCNTRIQHFDIKPHNILLDENFCPNISDFGLAKSCPQKDSIMLSMFEARGTLRCIAPEVFLKRFGGVSYKSDVYSYGMVVLEMVGCREKPDIECELSSEQYIPQWIYKQLEGEEEPNKEWVSTIYLFTFVCRFNTLLCCESCDLGDEDRDTEDVGAICNSEVPSSISTTLLIAGRLEGCSSICLLLEIEGSSPQANITSEEIDCSEFVVCKDQPFKPTSNE